jgi:tartrate dehydrogenase/decarboxylase/D-malate dehydrogenase
MLDHLGEQAAADAVEAAALNAMAGGGSLTPDLGGTATTVDVGTAVAMALE